MTRHLLLLGLLALSLPAAAQTYDPYGNQNAGRSEAVGVRIGVGVGASVYQGPDILVGSLAAQDDVVATNLAVTAEVSFPLGSENLRGRLLGGLLNIGADDTRADVPAGANPFLTSEVILAEADLLYYLSAPGRGTFSPYLFTGIGGLFATGDAAAGVSRSMLAIPVGVGAELAITRNLSIFGEAAYRFGLTSVGTETGTAAATASAAGFGPCTTPECKPCDDPSSTNPACKPCDDPNSTNTDCKPCDDPSSTNPDCDDVGADTDTSFDTRLNYATFTGGLRLGFSPAPQPYIPPYVAPVVVVPPPVIVPPVVVPPAVCDLVELNPVYFDYGSSTVSARARALLNENVELLLANPECCVFIDGTIDNQEMTRFGMPLGGRRAQAVYDFYLSRGVSASKLQIRNRGESTDNCDKEDPGVGCERSRRVETIPVDCERFRMMLENPSPY
ncbi:MAG TPA: OmpA family protein [Rubricoccaceae bacterium]|jgi:outer membrane protein OmpA-like peptidoglycan-associated protein/opacity protein-like surface antigen